VLIICRAGGTRWRRAKPVARLGGGGGLLQAMRVVAAARGWVELGAGFAGAGDLVFRADDSRFGGAVGVVGLDWRNAWFSSDQGLAACRITDRCLGQAWKVD
jgi:hypothetical protein